MKKQNILYKALFITLISLFIAITITLNLSFIVNKKTVFLILILIFVSILLMLLLNKFNNIINGIIDFISFILNSFILILTITTFIILPSKVEGSSMETTYQDGNRVFVNMFMPKYKTDDVVVYKTDVLIIKRLAATYNDKIQLIKKDSYYMLYINDELYLDSKDEPYIVYEIYELYKTIKEDEYILKEDEIILLGDNASGSKDSRETGILNKSNLVGKVIGGK